MKLIEITIKSNFIPINVVITTVIHIDRRVRSQCFLVCSLFNSLISLLGLLLILQTLYQSIGLEHLYIPIQLFPFVCTPSANPLRFHFKQPIKLWWRNFFTYFFLSSSSLCLLLLSFHRKWNMHYFVVANVFGKQTLNTPTEHRLRILCWLHKQTMKQMLYEFGDGLKSNLSEHLKYVALVLYNCCCIVWYNFTPSKTTKQT